MTLWSIQSAELSQRGRKLDHGRTELGHHLQLSDPQHNMGDSSYSSTTAALLAFSPLAYLANELIFLRELCTTNLSAFLLILQGFPAVVLCVHVSALASRRTAASSKARTATPVVASGVSPSSPDDGDEVKCQQAADAAAANAKTVKTSAKTDKPELDQENDKAKAGAPVELPRKGRVRDTAQYYEFLEFLASPEMKSLPSTPATSSRANSSDFEEETDVSSETSSTIPSPREEFLEFLATPEMKTLPSTPANKPGSASSGANGGDFEEEIDVSSETSSKIPVPRVVSKQQPPTRASSMNNIRKNLFGDGQSKRRQIF
ncbi:hypothetical protein THAOC_04949 [Thalassiosira oceanica]|uniref:Uncharacterized protein n=1 Tax=Thalassiosira oceanica TaxID=159749 RepID=K0TND3_THAOC|nr:hypothetical protein THAOC_04949 [Thalassiosira oceanica]|eukprot:EJK73422.1 hypothetical protein THAOC_04949 [Thalassiosira oceanica]